MDRPVTSSRHGLGAMGGRLGTAGQGRQLQDATYFTSLLSRKTKEITEEIKRLKEEINRLHKNNSSYQMVRNGCTSARQLHRGVSMVHCIVAAPCLIAAGSQV